MRLPTHVTLLALSLHSDVKYQLLLVKAIANKAATATQSATFV